LLRPEDFYSTTNHKTHVRHQQRWIEVENQRMDGIIVLRDNRAFCSRLRDLKRATRSCRAARHSRDARIEGARPLSFAFMSNGISSERQVDTAVRQRRRWCATRSNRKLRVLVVAGPVVVHTGGGDGLAALVRGGWVHGILAGNGVGVHDIEAGSSAFARRALSDGRRKSTATATTCGDQRLLSRGSVKQAWRAGD